MYLSGCKNPAIIDDLKNGSIGLLQTPANGYRLDHVSIWAMDNGCYTNAYPGDEGYLGTLDKLVEHQPRCLFVTIPDVVGDGQATLEKFQPMASRVRERGWKVALVVQDGMTNETVPWHQLDWIFIGGSTSWKLGPLAAELVASAKSRGVRVHAGRVNSWKRFSYFSALNCDSADGTFIAFGPEKNAPKVRQWISSDIQDFIF